MTGKGLQDQLFDVLLGRFSSKRDMVQDLMDLLNCGSDAAYRRVRGQSVLTPSELALLARHYNISLDRLVFEQTNKVLFTFNAFNRTVTCFDDYFDGILDHLAKLRRIPEVRIYYSSLEIPIFYYCFFPELISFKLYVWGRAIWDLSFTRDLPFSFDLISPSALAKAGQMLEFYLQLPSTELWSLNILDNTLNQIDYHLNSGTFKNPSDALVLIDRVQDLVRHMRSMATSGYKHHVGHSEELSEIRLLHNEMIYTNNTIMVQSPYAKGVFTTFGNPNFLFSDDERIIEYTEQWFKRVIAKSHPLSLGSEKSRNWFFHQLNERVSRTQTKVRTLIAI